MTLVPYLSYRTIPDDESIGYHVGIAVDELVDECLSLGCSPDELRERLEEAIERAAIEAGAE